jgi:hypothetical protein
MSSRGELVHLCKECCIYKEDMSIQDMKDALKEFADRKIDKIKYKSGDSHFSLEFIKFITQEYDYYLVDRNGKKCSFEDYRKYRSGELATHNEDYELDKTHLIEEENSEEKGENSALCL